MRTIVDTLCPHCGEYVSNLSERVYECVPDSCTCFRNWPGLKKIPPVCESYEEDPRVKGQCRICEHDEECHT